MDGPPVTATVLFAKGIIPRQSRSRRANVTGATLPPGFDDLVDVGVHFVGGEPVVECSRGIIIRRPSRLRGRQLIILLATAGRVFVIEAAGRCFLRHWSISLSPFEAARRATLAIGSAI